MVSPTLILLEVLVLATMSLLHVLPEASVICYAGSNGSSVRASATNPVAVSIETPFSEDNV